MRTLATGITVRLFQKRRILFQYAILLLALTFSFLTILAKQHPYFPFDLTISQTIQAINNPLFDWFMHFVTFLGNATPGIILTLLAVGILFLLKRRVEAAFLFGSAVGAQILSDLFKFLVGRPRPDPSLLKTIPILHTYSFPSGHVLFYLGFFGFLLFLTYTLLPKGYIRSTLLFLELLLLFSVGLSRIYVGAHWFSDVLGAYLLGFLWLMLVVFLFNKFAARAAIEEPGL